MTMLGGHLEAVCPSKKIFVCVVQGRLQLRKIIRFSMHDSNQNHKNPFSMSVRNSNHV